MFFARHSEDACRDSLIEWFQALKLIKSTFDLTQLQGMRLKQGIYVADLAVASVTSKFSSWLAKVVNQLQPPFSDLVQIDPVVGVTGVRQARDRLPPVSLVVVVDDSGCLCPLATVSVHLQQCSLQPAWDQLSFGFGGDREEMGEPSLAVVIERPRLWILGKEGSQAGGYVLQALDNAPGWTF